MLVRGPKRPVIQDLHTAFRRAHAERHPVVFNMPSEFQWLDTTYVPTLLKPRERHAAALDSQDLEDAVGVVAGSKRPIVVAGRGGMSAPARQAVLAFARRIGAPVMTTLKAKDLLRGEDCNIGVLGTVSSPEAVDAVLASDCVIGFGASLTNNTTSKKALVQGKRVVLVNDDATDVDNRHLVHAAAIGDCASVVERMTYWLDKAEVASSRFCEDEVVQTAIEAHRPKLAQELADGDNDVRLITRRINTLVDPNRILVTDGGRCLAEAWNNVFVSDSRLFVLWSQFGGDWPRGVSHHRRGDSGT